MGRHMGRCQPISDMQYPAVDKGGSHAVELMPALMLVMSSILRCLANCAMEINTPGTPLAFVHTTAFVWHSAASLVHHSVEWGREQEHPCSAANSGTAIRQRNRRCELNLAALVLIKSSSPGSCTRVHLRNSEMRGERQRMCSRRGGSRGRATTQRPAPTSPSSSVEVTSEPQHFHGNRTGRGRGMESERRMDCGHDEHPMVRYRIPCALANSTFIISVTVEHCDILREPAEATLDFPPPVHGTGPIIDLQRPVRESSPLVCPSALAGPSEPDRESSPIACPPALAGPSAHVQGRPSSVMIPLSDSDGSLHFGCQIEEAPYTTDDE